MQEKLIDELVEYSYWGRKNAPPEHLKTTKQLAEMGLKPVKALGKIVMKKYTILLYDPNDSSSVRAKKTATEAQLKALEKGRKKRQEESIERGKAAYYPQWWKREGCRLDEKNDAIEWAKHLLRREDWVVLDTETTGLKDAEIVQVAIINSKGETLLDSLVKPTIIIPEEVIEIHGITNEAVANAPTFPEIYPRIKEAIGNNLVIIYNAEADSRFLNHCCKIHELPSLKFKRDCAMEWASQFHNDWSRKHKSYRYIALGGNHNALGDCLTCLERIKAIATAEPIDLEDSFNRAYWHGTEEEQEEERERSYFDISV